MGRGLSTLQKSALTLAITLDPEHKRSKWQREAVTPEVAKERTEKFRAFFGIERVFEPDPDNATLYHLRPWELIYQHYCQRCKPTKAQQVAASKALSRLVDRGLMVKLLAAGGSHQYNLTDAGLQKANELLTANWCPHVAPG